MAFVRNNNGNNNNRRHNNNYSNNRHRHPNPNANPNNNPNNNGQRRHVNRVNQVFESNGPEGRIRGTAQQIVEKYTTMARDVAISGDKVLSMNYLQHAEHYQRLQNEITEENAAFERERDAQRQQQQQAQPEVSAADAAEGFVNPAQLHQAISDVEGSEPQSQQQPQQPQQPREQRQPRPERAPYQERTNDRSVRPERTPRPQRAPRPPMDDEIDDNDNQLPGFLQVPIKQGKPEVKAPAKAAPAAEQPEAPAVTAEAAPAPRVRAAPRPRRVAPAADDAAE